MKIKWRLWSGLTFAAVVLPLVLTWGVLAYIYMWPPMVWNYTTFHRTIPIGTECIINLHQLDLAVNQWALEHGKHKGDPVTLADIAPYIKKDRGGESSNGIIPVCPLGGTYSVTVVGAPPTCTYQGEKIRRSWFIYERGPGHYLP
jgi:hypothetical protein